MTLELTLVFPVVLFALAALVQAALWAHANHVVDAAAREGARSARLAGDPAAGRATAQTLIERHGDGVVVSPAVEAMIDGTVARVSVRGRAIPILPGLPLHLSATSLGEVERFVAPTAAVGP